MPRERGGGGPGVSLVVGLWIVVLIELVSPLPAVLTFGSAYVLAVRPRWFLRMIQELYGDRSP